MQTNISAETHKEEVPVNGIEAFVNHELFTGVVLSAVDASMQHLEQLEQRPAENIKKHGQPDASKERGHLETLYRFMDTDTENYKPTVACGLSVYDNGFTVRLVSKEDMGDNGDLILHDEHGNPKSSVEGVDRLRIRVIRPDRPDYYGKNPERIIVDTPEMVMSVVPEKVFLVDEERRYTTGTGVEIKIFAGGHAEIYQLGTVGGKFCPEPKPIETFDHSKLPDLVDQLPVA